MTQATAVTRRKDFLSVLDFDAADLERCLEIGARLKADRALGLQAPTANALNGRNVALLFEKPSLRTRTTFEIGIRELGGRAISIQAEVGLGGREPVADVARSLERWIDAIVIRTFSQRLIQQFASSDRLHVINALTDDEHPCQALADFLALKEQWGSLRGRTVAYVGDGNNVAASLAHGAAMLGVNLHIASPEGYQLSNAVVEQSTRAARYGARLRLFSEPADAVEGVDAIYTDTWTSMGKEAEAAVRQEAFVGFQVNEELVSLAKPDCLFMHCQPAHRGEEVTAEVFESPASIVFSQAEHRLHGQKALLLMLLAPQAAGV